MIFHAKTKPRAGYVPGVDVIKAIFHEQEA